MEKMVNEKKIKMAISFPVSRTIKSKTINHCRLTNLITRISPLQVNSNPWVLLQDAIKAKTHRLAPQYLPDLKGKAAQKTFYQSPAIIILTMSKKLASPNVNGNSKKPGPEPHKWKRL